MNTPLIAIHIVICIIIILIVLLQVGKGADAGAVFGGAGQVHSSRGKATFMGKFTAGMAIAFMVTSFFLTYDTRSSAKSSVIEQVPQQEQAQEAAPAPGNDSADSTDTPAPKPTE